MNIDNEYQREFFVCGIRTPIFDDRKIDHYGDWVVVATDMATKKDILVRGVSGDTGKTLYEERVKLKLEEE